MAIVIRARVTAEASEVGVVAATAAVVGWSGVLCGPVEFHGSRFYAVVRGPAVFGSPDSGWLIGCVVPGTDPYVAMSEASLLAAYGRRLIAVHGPAVRTRLDAADVRLQAALLDQGVTIHDPSTSPAAPTSPAASAAVVVGGGCSVLAWPGEVVPSLLWLDDRWPTDPRWRAFFDAVLTAPAHSATIESTS